MASKGEADSSDAPALDWMKCNICLDRFTQPRVLPCLHTFCHTCLERHTGFYCSSTGERSSSGSVVDQLQDRADRLRFLTYNGSSAYTEESFNALRDRLASSTAVALPDSTWRQVRQQSKTFPCPSCREKIDLPAAGINGFRHDFRVSQLQEWLENMKERQHKLEKENKRKHKHRRSASNSNKNDRQDEDMTTECWIHPEQIVSLICLDCCTGICKLCSKGTHETHNITRLGEGLALYRDSITSLCTAMTTRTTQLQKISEKLHDKETDVLTQETQLLEAIRETSEEAVRAVREEEKKLVLELKDRTRSNSSIIKNLKIQNDQIRENIENVKEYSQSVLSGPLSPDMISSYQDLVTQMDLTLEESSALGTGDVHVTTLQFVKSKSKNKLGKLKHREHDSFNLSEDTNLELDSSLNSTRSLRSFGAKPRKKGRRDSRSSTLTLFSQPHIQLISCFGQQGTRPGEFNSPGDICFLPSKDKHLSDSFIVADTNNNRLQIFNTFGTFVKVIGEGQIKPWGVTVTKNSNIVVSDTLDKCIKIYNMEGLCLQKFGKFLCPCGIAVNKDGNFVVTDFFSASVYTIDITGKVLCKFDFRTDSDAHMSGRSHISINKKDHLIISDMSNNSVKLFDKTGNLLHQMLCHDIQMSSTSGVCVDPTGHILVADTLGAKITILNRLGKVISHLDFQSGMRSSYLSSKQDELGFNGDPTGIAVSPTGNLVLTYSKSNQVHVYKLSNKQCSLQLRLDNSDRNQNESCPVQTVQF